MTQSEPTDVWTMLGSLYLQLSRIMAMTGCGNYPDESHKTYLEMIRDDPKFRHVAAELRYIESIMPSSD